MNAFFSLPFAAMPARMELGESLVYQLNGLIVVFAALSAIWLLLEVTGAYFKRQAAATVAPAAAPAAPPPAAPDEVLAPELVAAITAAVHTAVGAGCRIEAIVPAGATGEWAHEGRRQIFASHQLR